MAAIMHNLALLHLTIFEYFQPGTERLPSRDVVFNLAMYYYIAARLLKWDGA
jgi:hypothetical protein